MGGFFSISGYVAAYTTTKLRERGHDAKKFQEPELFFWQKVPHYILFHLAEVMETDFVDSRHSVVAKNIICAANTLDLFSC